jgi:uncharacterized peroxidase-related enzyme
MARIELAVDDGIPAAAAATLEAVQAAFGRVPNVFRAYAHHPPLLAANWEKVQRLMGEGRLAPRLKEAIAVAVSGDNGCEYCISVHSRALQALGASEAAVADLTADAEGIPEGFDERDVVLLRLVRKSNRAPLSITDEDVAAVRRAGWSDAELVEALGVMELFTGVNRFLDTLQIELDD